MLAQSQRPSAIFASNDDMAAATAAIAHRLGLDVLSDRAFSREHVLMNFELVRRQSDAAPRLRPPLRRGTPG